MLDLPRSDFLKNTFSFILLFIIEVEVSSISPISTMEDRTTDLVTIESTMSRPMNGFRALNEEVSIVPIAHQRAGSNEMMSMLIDVIFRLEYRFIWFGRIVNREWLKDYNNLNSPSSRNLRLDLENLVIHWIYPLLLSHLFGILVSLSPESEFIFIIHL